MVGDVVGRRGDPSTAGIADAAVVKMTNPGHRPIRLPHDQGGGGDLIEFHFDG